MTVLCLCDFLTGREYAIDNCPYKSIFYLWNEKNVYININKVENIDILVSEIKNKEYFIPAFFEEIKNKVFIKKENYFLIN
ncbi:hypothetical protein [Plasmodium yoelii yoelii]|uniref:Uncharacterized protein n=1 Tax=Plasmodium yoelii yoelii TaxID=73239 RepID=Q7RLM5_PLAYO|nr:hypothetical protein [Plasmodium yoelii yoelii]